jgi:hypothetical protein
VPEQVAPPRVAVPASWMRAAARAGLRSLDRDLLDLHGLRKPSRGTQGCKQRSGRNFNYERTRSATPTRHYPAHSVRLVTFLLLAGVR